jgi:hypothetical protein
MRVLLVVLAGIAFLAGVGIIGGAKSAIHEIEAFMLFLIAAVFISGAAIVESVTLMRTKLEAFMKNLNIE